VASYPQIAISQRDLAGGISSGESSMTLRNANVKRLFTACPDDRARQRLPTPVVSPQPAWRRRRVGQQLFDFPISGLSGRPEWRNGGKKRRKSRSIALPQPADPHQATMTWRILKEQQTAPQHRQVGVVKVCHWLCQCFVGHVGVPFPTSARNTTERQPASSSTGKASGTQQ
jgi:hypothetical protein